MKVQIRYENNRLDIFDTISFTKSEPFDGANMLTNFEIRIDTLGNTGLWLMAHYYETGNAFAKQTQEGEVPTARRKCGWKFLLAEEDELASIESVVVDEQVTLMRIAGELADMVRFDQMCELWLTSIYGECIAQKALRLFDTLCVVFPEYSANEERIARMCGFSMDAIDELRTRMPSDTAAASESGENDWLSDFSDCQNDC